MGTGVWQGNGGEESGLGENGRIYENALRNLLFCKLIKISKQINYGRYG